MITIPLVPNNPDWRRVEGCCTAMTLNLRQNAHLLLRRLTEKEHYLFLVGAPWDNRDLTFCPWCGERIEITLPVDMKSDPVRLGQKG